MNPFNIFQEGENATFINWGNLKIKKVNRPNGKVVSVDAEANLDDKV
jgi:bifunctional glutamyl/prolyl-tRNA synthetase